MTERLTSTHIQALYNSTYELEQQKAFAKHMRAMNRLSNDKNLEYITNEIYNNIIESAKKSNQRSHTTAIIEEGYEGELSGIYINEIKGNSNIDISGNYILNIFSNPILDISNNNLYDISGEALGQQLLSNMIIQGEIDISGNNVVVDASNNVLFKVSGNKVLRENNSEIATITEDTLSNRVLSKISDKFGGITGGILGEIKTSTPQNKSLVFDWSTAIVQWATYFDASNTEHGRSIITDSNNNIYMTGFYTSSTIQSIRNSSKGTVYANSGITLPATNGEATFLIKYNPEGIVQWATHLNGSGNDRGLSVDIDSSDNIYLSGYYSSTSNVQIRNVSGNSQTPSLISLPTSPSSSLGNAFLIKYSSSGIAQSATYLKGSGDVQGKNVKIDLSNNVYITGFYTSTANIFVQDVSGNSQTPSLISLPSTSGRAAFLIKYNSSGIAQWASYLDSTTNNDEGNGIAIDSFNNVYLTGFYNSLTLLDVKHSSIHSYTNSGIQLTGGNNNGYFLIKYNSSGLVQWATCQRTGSTGIIGNSITIDSNNNICVVGTSAISGSNYRIVNAITSGSSYTLSNLQFNSSGGATLLIKYNSNGEVQWGVVTDSNGTDSGNYVVTDSLNNVYITGVYDARTTQVTLNNGYVGQPVSAIASAVRLPLTPPTGVPQGVFLIKYNSDGLVQWASHLNGSANDSGQCIAIDSLNNIYLSGLYRSSSEIPVLNASKGIVYTNSGIILPTSNVEAAFLIKYS
jgi:hypothetical protein